MNEVFVGRQPIYNPQLDVFGYEILYRDSDKNEAQFLDGDAATAKVILNTFMEIGLERIVGEKPAFINITRNLLLNGDCTCLPRDRVILEILEDIEPDELVIAALRDLSTLGYTIALDDFVYHPDLLALVEIANIVKLDLLGVDREQLSEHVSILRKHKVELLAEKVETHEDFEFCKTLGFDYFQGYFLCRPKVISGQQVPTNRLNALRIIAKLQEPNVEPRELEELISTDLTLSYKMLRFVNSSSCSLNRRIESIREAAIFVGIRWIRAWAMLLMLDGGMDDKPREIIVTAATRGKMCEFLAEKSHQEPVDTFFTAGLLSLLPAFVDKPMAEVLELLPLSPVLNDALMNRDGVVADTLRCVVNYEQGKWDKVRCRNLSRASIRDAYLEAVFWSDSAITELRAA